MEIISHTPEVHAFKMHSVGKHLFGVLSCKVLCKNFECSLKVLNLSATTPFCFNNTLGIHALASKLEMWYLHTPDHTTPYKVTMKAVNDLYKENYFKHLNISNYSL